jgi:heme oxygenase
MIAGLGRDIDIMSKLKSRTIHQHQSMESVVPIFRKDFSREAYVELLEAFLGFFEPVERNLATIQGWQNIGLDLDKRMRASLLRKDLAALRHDDSETRVLAECTNLPRLSSMEEAMGCMYVLEGSTLGGQFIYRELQSRFGISVGTGASFFYGYGAQSGAMWAQFSGCLREFSRRIENQDRIVDSAVSTFDAFETWIRGANEE